MRSGKHELVEETIEDGITGPVHRHAASTHVGYLFSLHENNPGTYIIGSPEARSALYMLFNFTYPENFRMTV